MTKKEKVKIILTFLEENYEDAKCFLNYSKPYELLIAARLSAQCTDKRVNMVTKKLFLKYDDITSLATASFEEIKKIINSCGLANVKSKDIINISLDLINKFNKKVPNDMKNLISLPGIGRKTANLVLAEIYNKPAIIVDTHMIRISNRLGLVTNEKNAMKIEDILIKLIPKNKSTKFCHMIVSFGKDLCKSKRPICEKCKLKKICLYINKFM